MSHRWAKPLAAEKGFRLQHPWIDLGADAMVLRRDASRTAQREDELTGASLDALRTLLSEKHSDNVSLLTILHGLIGADEHVLTQWHTAQRWSVAKIDGSENKSPEAGTTGRRPCKSESRDRWVPGAAEQRRQEYENADISLEGQSSRSQGGYGRQVWSVHSTDTKLSGRG